MMPHLSPIVKTRLEEKLAKLNKLRPLPKSAVQKLREKNQIEMTYNSNAIEGNSLTLKETFLIINEGVTIKGKPLKDHLEAKDHHAALEYLYDLLEKDKKHTVSEMLIRNLHRIITLVPLQLSFTMCKTLIIQWIPNDEQLFPCRIKL